MLPAYALRPLLRYFDAVDDIVSQGLVTVKAHQEIGLTSDLCSLMDEREQGRYAIRHDLGWLRRQLTERIGDVDVEVDIDTIEYPQKLENLVTQSDLGLVVEFDDYTLPSRSWTAAALLQAKRLTAPIGTGYSASSSFGAYSSTQRRRIKALHSLLGYDVVKYLLYTPRPEHLDVYLADQLRYRRDLNITRPIFDFAAGLTVHRELTRRRRFVDGGIIVAPIDPKPSDLQGTYDRLLGDSLTWAWYVGLLLIDTSNAGGPFEPPGLLPARWSRAQLSRFSFSPVGLASGDRATATAIAQGLGQEDLPRFPFLPRRSIRIRVAVGGDGQVARDRSIPGTRST